MKRPRQPFRPGDRVRRWDRRHAAHGAICTVVGVDVLPDGAHRYGIRLPTGDGMPCAEDKLELIRRAPPPREGDWVNVIDPRRAAYGGPYVVVRISPHAADPDYWLGGTGRYSLVFSLPFRQDQVVVVRRAPKPPITWAAAPTAADRFPAAPPEEDPA